MYDKDQSPKEFEHRLNGELSSEAHHIFGEGQGAFHVRVDHWEQQNKVRVRFGYDESEDKKFWEVDWDERWIDTDELLGWVNSLNRLITFKRS